MKSFGQSNSGTASFRSASRKPSNGMASGGSCNLSSGVLVQDLTSRYWCWVAAIPISLRRCRLLETQLRSVDNPDPSKPYYRVTVANIDCRYDAGCRAITNIDFSKVCIKEMLMKNLRQRPHMKWLVMDMTQLTVQLLKFRKTQDASCTVVLVHRVASNIHAMAACMCCFLLFLTTGICPAKFAFAVQTWQLSHCL